MGFRVSFGDSGAVRPQESHDFPLDSPHGRGRYYKGLNKYPYGWSRFLVDFWYATKAEISTIDSLELWYRIPPKTYNSSKPENDVATHSGPTLQSLPRPPLKDPKNGT